MNNIAFIVACRDYTAPLPALLGVDQDADMMEEVLIDNCACTEENVIKCTCREDSIYHPVHPGSIVEMIRDVSAKKSFNNSYDVVYFYFSGHGFNKNGHLFLALQTTDITLGFSNIVNDISKDTILTALEQSQLSKTFVCIFDTCQTELHTKGLSEKDEARNGFVVFTSCRQGTSSYLLPDRSGSVFTKCLVKALGRNSECTTVQEVHDFINVSMKKLCLKIKHEQEPVTSLQNISLAHLVITCNKSKQLLVTNNLEFYLGRYPQNPKGKKMDVLWRIIGIDHDRKQLLAISQIIIDVQPYNTTENLSVLNWESTSLYSWINSKLYNELFNTRERSIVRSISLLNEDQARMAFQDNKSRKALASNYAIKNGLFTDKRFSDSYGEYGQWWLKSDIVTSGKAKRVFCDGAIYPRGRKVNRKDIGIRPVITIDQTATANIDINSIT